jgi:hypothetical protein
MPNAPTPLAQARAALARGDIASAREHARDATSIAPHAGEAWLFRAIAALAAGDLDDAESAFRQLRELAPDDARGHAGLGQVAATRGDTAASLAHLHEAARRKPRWSEPSLRIGEALRAAQPEKAGGWFLRAALGDPPQPAALHGLLACALALRAQAPPRRELHLPRPLPSVTIVRSDANPAHADSVRAAIERHARPLLPTLELLEPEAGERSRAAWLNRAIARARGEMVVVLRGDAAPIGDDFLPLLLEELMYADIVGVVGTHWLVAPALDWAGAPWLQGWPLRRDGARVVLSMLGLESPASRGLQALDGTLLALRRELAQQLRFDEGFGGWHLCELELSHRAYRLGLRLSALAPFPLLQDGPPPFDESVRPELARFTQLYAVPPPFARRATPGAGVPVEDIPSALAAAGWLEHICAQRWRLSWELPPSPLAA